MSPSKNGEFLNGHGRFDALLTTEQLAERWGMEPGSLENWRREKKGPVSIKLGEGDRSPVRYRLADVEKFEKESEQR